MYQNQNEINQIIHEFPDRAIRWLLETPDNVKGLLLAVVADLAKNIDYNHLQRLDRTFISDNFRKREADLVFTAPFLDEQEGVTREVIIYILIENENTDAVRDSIQTAIKHLRSMPPEERANWSKLIYFMMAFIYERREETEHDEFFNIIRNSIDDKSQRKEAEEMGKTMSQVLQEKGEARGEARAKITTKQEDIIKLIRIRFEYVPENLIKSIKSTTQIEQLDTIFERVAIAKTIKDLEF